MVKTYRYGDRLPNGTYFIAMTLGGNVIVTPDDFICSDGYSLPHPAQRARIVSPLALEDY